jgi:hypothetical protein
MYSSTAHRITVASDIRRSRAITRIFRRWAVASVIVNRSDLVDFLLLACFITHHHIDEYLTSMMTVVLAVNNFMSGRSLPVNQQRAVNDGRNLAILPKPSL